MMMTLYLIAKISSSLAKNNNGKWTASHNSLSLSPLLQLNCKQKLSVFWILLFYVLQAFCFP
jgi:hypothetical protein